MTVDSNVRIEWLIGEGLCPLHRPVFIAGIALLLLGLRYLSASKFGKQFKAVDFINHSALVVF